MPMRRVIGSGSQPNQHCDDSLLFLQRELNAGYPWRNFIPFPKLTFYGRPCGCADALREPIAEVIRRTEDGSGPVGKQVGAGRSHFKLFGIGWIEYLFHGYFNSRPNAFLSLERAERIRVFTVPSG